MKRPAIAGAVVAAVLAFAAAAVPTAAEAPFTRIVVFGTSLSDSGNAFALRDGRNTPPDYDVDLLLVPGSPYARGGHHVSNGATWIEQYARTRGLAGGVRPALASSNPGATDFAVAGARAYEDGANFNLSAQVAAFLEQSGGIAPSDALYVVEMGANDIRDALTAAGSGGGPNAVLAMALQSINANIGILYAAGARHFLVWSAPNVGLTPAIRAIDAVRPGTAAGATALTVGFNDGLDLYLAGLSALPDITIDRLDAFTLLNQVVADPSAFDLTNVTMPCITPNVAPFFCQQPDAFLFWDGIHPTTAGHAILAQEAARVLGQ